jgi:hypothetical protein
MIRHIVLLKLDATEPAVQSAHARELTSRIEALAGVVPGLRNVRVDRDLGDVATHFDLALVAEHDDADALKIYQTHPAHVEVADWIRTVASVRAVVDSDLDRGIRTF